VIGGTLPPLRLLESMIFCCNPVRCRRAWRPWHPARSNYDDEHMVRNAANCAAPGQANPAGGSRRLTLQPSYQPCPLLAQSGHPRAFNRFLRRSWGRPSAFGSR
jgi:hypothetical protein